MTIGTRRAADLIEDTLRWRVRISRTMYAVGDDEGVGLVDTALEAAMIEHHQVETRHSRGWHGPGWSFASQATADEVRPLLRTVHAGLTHLDRSLGRAPLPPALPVVHPPGFARLKEEQVAESVAERLAELVSLAVERYRTPRRIEHPENPRQPAFNHLFEEALRPFLTTEVRDRYRTATGRFGGIEALGGAEPSYSDSRDPDLYRKIERGTHARMYAAHLAIAINYLAEVQDLMPEYARASGQERPQPPVSVTFNGEMYGSQVNVATTITSIGASVEAVAGRGQTEVAAALRALSEAIRQAPELGDATRVELLHHLADLAEGAARPEQPRLRSRAKAALAALTAAAGASTQLAQAVAGWHDVLSKLF